MNHQPVSAPPLTRALARFATGVTWTGLPAAARERVVLHTLDQVGAALAGSTMRWNQTVREYAEAETPPGPSTIYGTAASGRPEWAALANATAGHGLEIDDYHVPALVHPGCVVVPTVLAAGEAVGARGHEALAALAVGFESIVRVGLATTPSLTSDRGFHVTGVHGVVGAALAAARLHGLDPDTAASALGLAASHAGGLTEYTRSGGEVKRLHAGLAAMGGLRSVSLAARGFTGPPTVLEGPRGYLRAFAATSHPDRISDGLGEVWRLDGLVAKVHCACAGIHAPLEAVAALRREGLRTAEVEEVVVGMDPASMAHTGKIGPRPRDMAGAQFSAHYSVAMQLVLGGNDLAHYQQVERSGYRIPEVSALAERVRLEVDPAAAAAFPDTLTARVTAHRRRGGPVTAAAHARGTAGDHLPAGEIRAKFHRLATTAVSPAQARQIETAVLALTDDAPVTDVLSPLRQR